MSDTLALHGGTPVRRAKERAWPAWPVGTEEDAAAVAAVVRSGKWTRWTGDRVVALERRLEEHTGARRAICVTSGTAALEVALKAAGVRPGDEVIIPAYTYISTATAVLQVGGIPVFADVIAETQNIDPESAAAAVTVRTRAIVPVHVCGLPCDMQPILDLAQRHGLRVIEDAASGIGGTWKDRRLGTIGDAGTYTFQQSENLPAGEGGAIVTNDDVLADKAFARMHVGRAPSGRFFTDHVLGWNYRMMEFPAALALSQFERFPALQARRRENAARLRDALARVPGIVLAREDGFVAEHGLHGYACRYVAAEFAPDVAGGLPRRTFLEALRAEGIPCGSGYDVPLYRDPLLAVVHEALRDDCPIACGHAAARDADYGRLHLPVAERLCAAEALWFPQTVLLGDADDVQDVGEAIGKVQASAVALGAARP